MITLTCRTTGQPALVNPARLSSIAPHGAGSGSLIRTVEGEYVPARRLTGLTSASRWLKHLVLTWRMTHRGVKLRPLLLLLPIVWRSDNHYRTSTGTMTSTRPEIP